MGRWSAARCGGGWGGWRRAGPRATAAGTEQRQKEEATVCEGGAVRARAAAGRSSGAGGSGARAGGRVRQWQTPAEPRAVACGEAQGVGETVPRSRALAWSGVVGDDAGDEQRPEASNGASEASDCGRADAAGSSGQQASGSDAERGSERGRRAGAEQGPVQEPRSTAGASTGRSCGGRAVPA
nr:uncharacterized protein LOC109765041 [Aegilops tauschii subsp. strangulata]